MDANGLDAGKDDCKELLFGNVSPKEYGAGAVATEEPDPDDDIGAAHRHRRAESIATSAVARLQVRHL